MNGFQKTLQIVCNNDNKIGDNSYSISFGNLGKDSFIGVSLIMLFQKCIL